MYTKLLRLSLAFFIVFSCSCGSGFTALTSVPSDAFAFQEAFVKVAQEIKPAVVNVSSTHVEEYEVPQYEFFFGSPFEEFFGDDETPSPRRNMKRKFEAQGSGVIIDPKGYILTNYHVISDAEEITVTLSDGEKLKGKVTGKDPRTDLAVISVNAGRVLPFVRLGDSDKVRVGEVAIAVGSPFGLQQTVTSGIVSAVRQSLVIEGKEFRNLIQTDAAINQGNSGGPLCSLKGEVIGINSAIYAPTGVFNGIGFAIPINNAKSILSDLISKGRVVRGWLGVEIKKVDAAIAKSFRLPDESGVLVNGVVGGSPADKAGVKRGDVIRFFDGQKISDPNQLQAVASKTQPKKKVKLEIIRQGRNMTLDLVMGESPEAEASLKEEQLNEQKSEKRTFEWNGVTVTELTPRLAKRYEIPEGEKGCVVVSVKPDSIAQKMELSQGDLIESVNDNETETLEMFKQAVYNIDKSNTLVLDVNRQGQRLYISYVGGK
jgi:serine protease Do